MEGFKAKLRNIFQFNPSLGEDETLSSLNRALFFRVIIVGICILASRLWLIHTYSGAVPFWDQWDAEAQNLYIPYLNHTLSLSHFLAAHNEHRIILSRILALGLFIVSGQWDTRLQMTVNAIIFSFFLTGLAFFLSRFIKAKNQNIFLIGYAIIWMIPYAWENTLGGFQSAFYLMFGFSIIALWGLVDSLAFTNRWWIGIMATLFSCLTLASGFFILPVIILIRLFKLVFNKEPISRHLITLIFAFIVIGINIKFMTRVEAHQSLQAHNLLYFFLALGKSISWPIYRIPVLCLLFQAPLILLGLKIFKDKTFKTNAYWVLMGLGGWALLQSLAIAYSRGAYGAYPTSRYQDILALGIVVNFTIIYSGIIKLGQKFILAWNFTVLCGLVMLLSLAIFKWLPQTKYYSQEQLLRSRAYLATHDIRYLSKTTNRLDIPYPDPNRLAQWLSDPRIQEILTFSPKNPEPGDKLRWGITDP